jgi:hypothetical protein
MVSYSKIKRDFNQSMFGNHPGNVSMDSNQAGATMASRFIVAKNAAIIGVGVAPVGKIISGGRAVTGSTAYKIYGAIKRPILTLGVHKKITGATTAMSLSKAYSKSLLAASVFNFGRNVQLARAKEYKRLGINVFGPPLSLFLYDHHMAHNMDAEAEIAIAKQEQSGVGGSLPSKPKTPGKYKPRRGQRCRPGYKLINGMCVKQ